MTISDMLSAKEVISWRRVFIAAGMDPSTMKSRMRRGSPELTEEEAKAIIKVLKKPLVRLCTVACAQSSGKESNSSRMRAKSLDR